MRPDRPLPLFVVAASGAVHLLLLCAPALVLADSPWGLVDVRVAMFLALATGWYACECAAQPARPEAYPAAGPAWLPLAGGVAVLLTFWTSLVGRAATGGGLLAVSAFAGAGLMLLGLVLRRLAIRTLGRYFLDEIALLPDQQLVTHGVYRRLRHPSEAGTLCLAAGAALLLASPPGLLACLFLVLPYVLLRTRLEDRLLAQRHASAFAAYARTVPPLLPRLRALGHLNSAARTSLPRVAQG